METDRFRFRIFSLSREIKVQFQFQFQFSIFNFIKFATLQYNLQLKLWIKVMIIHMARKPERNQGGYKRLGKFGFINGVDNVNWPPYRDSKSF